MTTCPMCGSNVPLLKSGCHVIPRAFLKRTKESGKNVRWDFRENRIAINQVDEKGDFWCGQCESTSAELDRYGADVLLHRTEGTWKTNRNSTRPIHWLSDLDYRKFRSFVLSIPIRDHLLRKITGSDLVLTDACFSALREDYCHRTDSLGVICHFLAPEDPLSGNVFGPVATKTGNGTNFQLFNFSFMVCFEIDPSVRPLLLSPDGRIPLVELHHTELGAYSGLDESYSMIFDRQENQDSLARIRKK